VVAKEWVGTGITESGFIEKINQPPIKEMLKFEPMSDVEYDALVTFTELHKKKD
jgi:hypothetical protein